MCVCMSSKGHIYMTTSTQEGKTWSENIKTTFLIVMQKDEKEKIILSNLIC